ncbi:MAG TPA: hypothetical protein VGE11_26885 [Pseudonocardia sp.]
MDRLLSVEVTEADDGLSRRVAQHVYDERLVAGEGKYFAGGG